MKAAVMNIAVMKAAVVKAASAIIVSLIVFYQGGLRNKWLVNPGQSAPVHIPVQGGENAVNALLTTVKTGKFPDASFPRPGKKPGTDL